MNELMTVDHQRMGCMEIWGGNRAIEKSFEAPGLDIYVHSQPFQNAERGGDIYYLTSCASGRVSRFLLADVSGHGDAAAGLAKSLRDLLRQNVNRISQDQFVAGMNREFRGIGGRRRFSQTAVVATFLSQLARWISVSPVTRIHFTIVQRTANGLSLTQRATMPTLKTCRLELLIKAAIRNEKSRPIAATCFFCTRTRSSNRWSTIAVSFPLGIGGVVSVAQRQSRSQSSGSDSVFARSNWSDGDR